MSRRSRSGGQVLSVGAAGGPATPVAALHVPAPPYWLAVVAVTAAALLWSSSFAVTKVALRDMGPLTIGALRFTGRPCSWP